MLCYHFETPDAEQLSATLQLSSERENAPAVVIVSTGNGFELRTSGVARQTGKKVVFLEELLIVSKLHLIPTLTINREPIAHDGSLRGGIYRPEDAQQIVEFNLAHQKSTELGEQAVWRSLMSHASYRQKSVRFVPAK